MTNICSSIKLLVAARQETIEKLGKQDHGDKREPGWRRAAHSGGYPDHAHAGAAAPLLIAGIATSSVGAATNIGTSVAEKILNSKQIKEMNEAFARDKEITRKFESQLEDIKRYKESAHLSTLYYSIKDCIGEKHILLPVLQSVLLYDKEAEAKPNILSRDRGEQLKDSDEQSLEASGSEYLSPTTPSLLKQDSKDNVKFNPIDAGMFNVRGKWEGDWPEQFPCCGPGHHWDICSFPCLGCH